MNQTETQNSAPGVTSESSNPGPKTEAQEIITSGIIYKQEIPVNKVSGIAWSIGFE